MISEILEEKYGVDTPIFTEEILSLFPQYSRAYVFRLIKSDEGEGKLTHFDTGVYYIPQMTLLGPSTITASDVARKRYIYSDGNIYGIYGGLMLQNAFSVTEQLTNTPEIITNREATRCRRVSIDGMTFILRESRTKITNENADVYCILQLFSETNGFNLNEKARSSVADFLTSKEITRSSLLEVARYFPSSVLSNLIYSGVIA